MLSPSGYELVPLQDVTTSSDIDWSKPIADIDRQLYAKYHLTTAEITFTREDDKVYGVEFWWLDS